MTKQKNYRVIGACSCWGAQIRTCEKGPQDLLDAEVFEKLEHEGVKISEVDLIFPEESALGSEVREPLWLINEFNRRLADQVFRAMRDKEIPVVVAGDHSCAVGTWNGVSKLAKPIGLLWIDAHMDAHTPETSPSGAWHGMPLAALLGKGPPEMAQLLNEEPVLRPEQVVVIGVRSYEAGEKNLLDQLGVKIYYIDEVKEKGFVTVLEEALQIVNHGTVGFGISIDVDVIDPEEAPGVGSPEAGGIEAGEFLLAMPLLGEHPKLIGVEIVEYNPERDKGHKTRELVYQMLKGLLL